MAESKSQQERNMQGIKGREKQSINAREHQGLDLIMKKAGIWTILSKLT